VKRDAAEEITQHRVAWAAFRAWRACRLGAKPRGAGTFAGSGFLPTVDAGGGAGFQCRVMPLSR
jgi:hypothetical protein